MIWAENISFSYKTQLVLKNVSFAAKAGECVLLTGQNGAGKTTLLRILSGCLTPSQGIVYIDNFGNPTNIHRMAPHQVAKRVAMVQAHTQPAFDFTVWQLVEMGLYPHKTNLFDSNQEGDLVSSALQKTQLLEMAQRPFSSLSSGQQKRIWLALALAQQPKLLLLDEPFVHLDAGSQAEWIQVCKQLVSQGTCIIMTSHQPVVGLQPNVLIAL